MTNPDGSDTETKTDYIDVFLCSYAPVRILEEYYVSIQEAYDHANDGDVIQCQALSFGEGLYFDRDISVTIKGGYVCDYAATKGASRTESMVIRDGSMTIDGMVIQ